MSTNFIGMEKKNLEPVAQALNAYLADLGVLYIKLHNLHWNVEGSNFFQIHAKLEEFYDSINEALDEVAERILTIGFLPLASLKDYLAHARIKEIPSTAVKGDAALSMVREDFTHMLTESRKILALAEEARDQGTVDLMAGFIGSYEKTLWMIKAVQA